MTDHFKELEAAAAYVVNGGERDLPSAIHWLTDAFNALLDRAHFEAILEDNERTGLAEAKREREAVLAARPLAEKATELAAHVYAQIEKLAPGLLVHNDSDTWARTAHADKWRRLRVEVTPAYRVLATSRTAPARIDLVGDVSGVARYRFPVKTDGSFNVALVVKRLRGDE